MYIPIIPNIEIMLCMTISMTKFHVLLATGRHSYDAVKLMQ